MARCPFFNGEHLLGHFLWGAVLEQLTLLRRMRMVAIRDSRWQYYGP